MIRRRTMVSCGLAAVLLLAPLTGAAAGPPSTRSTAARPDSVSSDFWKEVKTPGYRRSRTLIAQGLKLLVPPIVLHLRRRAQSGSHGFQKGLERTLTERAIVRFRRAHRYAPRDPESLYLLAITRMRWRDPSSGSFTERDGEILALLERLRRRHPDYHAATVSFQLAILSTRAHRFDRAIAEYERCLDHLLPVGSHRKSPPAAFQIRRFLFGKPSAATVHYNLAEVIMQKGDLEGAVARYRRAMEASRRSNAFETRILSLWGLAVALDRLGEHASARDRAREASRLDKAPMRILESDGVFFEPDYELHYLKALGHMALAEKRDAERSARLRHLRRARSRWERFLSSGGDESPWAEVAEKHLQTVQRKHRRLAGD